MFKLCLGYLKSTQLFNTYMQILFKIFSSSLHSYVFTMQQKVLLFLQICILCIHHALKQNSFYTASRSSLLFPTSFLAFTQCYVYSMLCDETYLQPMFSLCDMLIQLYHEIKVTQLLHKRIFSCVTHMRNNVVYAFPLGMLMVQVKQRSQKAYFQSIKQCFKLKNLKIICYHFFVLADSFLVRRFMF